MATNVTDITDLTSFSGFGTFMAVFGTIGNVLSLAVALRPKVRGNSFSIFLAALAVADSLVLWAQAFLLITFYKVSPSYCTSRPFLLMYPEAQANWIIAGLTLERAILIMYPMKATYLGFGKQKSGFMFVGILVCLVLAIHLPSLFFLEFNEAMSNCDLHPSLIYASTKLYPWLTVALFFYLPMLIIIACNVCIIRKLVAKATDGGGLGSSNSNQLMRIAVTVSVVSIVYVVLEMCNTIIRTQLAAGVIDGIYPPPEFFASMMACQTNHGINIVLYCLTGEHFRGEFLNILRILCCLGPSKKTTGKAPASSTDKTTPSTEKTTSA